MHWGSLFHGIMMELLPEPWPELMHVSEVKVMSQCILPQSATEALWRIRLLDDGLAQAVQDALISTRLLRCRHTRDDVRVMDVRHTVTPLQRVLEQAQEHPEGTIRMNILTPASHKVHGQFVTLPSVELIGRSIARRVTNVLPDFVIADREILQCVLDGSSVGKYAIQSTTYQLEGHYVPAYKGWIEINYNGPEEMYPVWYMLFSMAEWTGIGVKTSLGMGGCHVGK